MMENNYSHSIRAVLSILQLLLKQLIMFEKFVVQSKLLSLKLILSLKNIKIL